MSRASVMTERELSEHLEALLDQRKLRLVAREIRIGSLRLDAVAIDEFDDSLVVVELKTTRWCGTLAQLLLYPRALRKAIIDKGLSPPVIRSLLITTYLDKGLIDLVADHELSDTVRLAVCVGSVAEGLRIVDPTDPEAESALRDQAEGNHDIEKVLAAIRDTQRK